ncbi:MAG TPA: hypothetical protein VFK28_07145 [Sphingomicrobium sp.]|nr:hypothetical protein [Sphingomicrobium sp.]
MIGRAAILLTGAALAVPAAASAQTLPEVPQISTPVQSRDLGTTREARTSDAPQQLSHPADSTMRESQLSPSSASQQQPTQVSTAARNAQSPQVSTAARNAQPPQPLSSPSQGRTGAIERVSGTDRCDPAIPPEKRSDECKQVIETRAAEYARPSRAELSPEQRLLIDQRFRAGNDVADATRSLAISGEPDSAQAMGIASIVLDRQNEPQPRPGKEQDPAADAAIEAIANLLSVTPPPQN